jgi:Nif-specific regulatory protein
MNGPSLRRPQPPQADLAELAFQLAALPAQVSDPAGYLQEALRQALRAVGAQAAVVLQGQAGQWRTVAWGGSSLMPPAELASEALSRQQPVAGNGWLVAPLEYGEEGELLCLVGAAAPWNTEEGRLTPLVRALGAGLAVVRQRQRDRRRVEQLQSLLAIAAPWQTPLTTDQLLVQLAQVATRLLDAERASIFLWDRVSRTLVARPALGVEEEELRIPDHAGVVGQVIRSGQPQRVARDDPQQQEQIDRRVDRRLNFHTRSLVCVPLRSARGDVLGAFEVLNKRHGDFTADDEQTLAELCAHAAAALEHCRQWEQLVASRRQIAEGAWAGVQLVGQCPAIRALRATIQRLAETDLVVLILGEHGTGKEVVAQMLHSHSRRRHEPLIAVNCAALTETLLESELFGHEKGAFTDARQTRQGKFELASRGTLFLDEIGDMSLAGQAKLLRVLEEKTVTRVGGSVPIATDARVIAATNQNLAELVRQKRFREDLFFRLSVVTLELPPLRERGEDVLVLAEHFLAQFAAKARRSVPQLTPAARQRLLAHRWPGNVRELRNLMERLVYLTPPDHAEIDAADLAFTLPPAGDGHPPLPQRALAEATRQFQQQYIRQQIDRCRGNMTAVAASLGLHRSNLYRKMRQLGMDEARDPPARDG